MSRFIAGIAFAVTGFFFTIPAWAQTVSMVTLTNGPPNIPNASPCTTTTCAWIGAGWPSGTHVSLVYADMKPISSDYTGTFSLSDQPGHTGDASHFSVSTTAIGYTDSFNNSKSRNVGEIKTSGTVSAGDYFVIVTAAGAGGANTQNVTVHTASGTNVSCGGSIPTSGTVILAPNCTYFANTPGGSQINNLTGTLIGAGNGSTIFDGQNTACGGVNQNDSQPGGAVIGIQFQNYKCTVPQGYPVLTYINTVVRNSRMINSAGAGITIQGAGAFVANNLIDNMGYSGMTATVNGPSSQAINVIGNEISRANSGGYDTCNDAATIKYLPGIAVTINFTNNYIHDSTGPGPWPDTTSSTVSNISGNTLVRMGGAPGAIMIEQTSGGTTIDHNVFVHNGDGSAFQAFYCDSSAPVGQPPPYCASGHCVFPSGDPGPAAAIAIFGSRNVDVHDNNISANSVSYTGKTYQLNDEVGNGTDCSNNLPDISNNTIHDNTLTFFTTNSAAVWGFDQVGCANTHINGISSGSNHFHLIGGSTGSDRHWYWLNQGNTAQTFANYRSSGQDANSTIDTTDTSTTGCTHVACSGSGIGAGGVPLTGPTALSIQSVALSNSTFTPNVANGAVGTVSVTMSDGSAFSGKLSITGTNSGGFHLSGNTLEEKASGTPAGSYNDFNIVATQSTAANSPQQISPTVTGCGRR
jgi:hypothetical protein